MGGQKCGDIENTGHRLWFTEKEKLKLDNQKIERE